MTKLTASKELPASTDLSALFGIDVDQGHGASMVPPAGVLCGKCSGRGSFVGYSGKVIGKCFTCDGTGLERNACREIKSGDCAKCAGSGEWRPGRGCFACNGTGREEPQAQAAAINVTAIETAFHAATANGIKRPKLRLADFIFSLAPVTGKNAGAIYVKRGDEYLGKVIGGEFHACRGVAAETIALVIEVASDPHKAAKTYGLRTGSCSCCGRELTNGISIDLGIGPICREKFGWA